MHLQFIDDQLRYEIINLQSALGLMSQQQQQQ